MHHTCNHCNKPIVGRTDKKYCSNACRVEAFRLRQDLDMKSIRDINAGLLKNRTIMKSLCASSGNIVVERRTLLALGMDFSIFTSLYTTATGRAYYFCYDYAFSPTVEAGTAKAIIVSRHPELPSYDPWKSSTPNNHPNTV